MAGEAGRVAYKYVTPTMAEEVETSVLAVKIVTQQKNTLLPSILSHRLPKFKKKVR